MTTQRGKTSIFPRRLRERLTSVTGALRMNHVFCVSLRVSIAPCWKETRKRREQRCSLMEKAKNQRMERERAIAELESWEGYH